jgi:hypothetical protein
MAEWRATAATSDQPSLSGTPPTARQLLVVIVRWELWFDRYGENTSPPLPGMPAMKAEDGTELVRPHWLDHPLRCFFPAVVAASRPHRSFS